MEITFLAIAIALCCVTGLIHTLFFIWKMIHADNTSAYEQINVAELGGASHHHHDHHHHHHGGNEFLSGSVHLSSTEVMCFMGWVWGGCVHHDRMAKSTFVAWYLTVMSLDIGVSVGLYFILSLYINI